MKKLYFTFIVCVAVVAAGYNVYKSNKGMNFSGLMLSNIEALADPNESQKGCKLHLTSICETSHADRYLYRNR